MPTIPALSKQCEKYECLRQMHGAKIYFLDKINFLDKSDISGKFQMHMNSVYRKLDEWSCPQNYNYGRGLHA